MPITVDFYKSLADEMVSKYKRLNYFTKHPGSIGTFHEEILKSTIRQFLPKRYSLKTGFVYINDKVSNQMDILIIDESEATSYYFQEEDLVVVHPNAVVCAIEVKTSINNFKSFKSAIENIISFNTLYSQKGVTNHSAGMIFSFDSINFSSKIDTLNDWWKKIPSTTQNLYPMKIFSLKKGVFDLRKDKANTKAWGHYFVMGEEKDRYKAKSLSVFLMSIRKLAELHSGNSKGNPFNTAIFNGLLWSLHYLRFGAGKLP